MSTFTQILRTPIWKLAIGRIAPAWPYQKAVRESDLPAPVQALISSIVRRTRLWRNEKFAVATELVAHFHDALASGSSAEEVVQQFGDAKLAAKLIRRAKIRCRPLAWHLFSAIQSVAVVIFAVYFAFAVYFVLGRPRITTDYLAELNRPAAETPMTDRAWPIWQQALTTIRDDFPKNHHEIPDPLIYAVPGSKDYEELRRYLGSRPEALALAQRASAKPELGLLVGTQSTDLPLVAILVPDTRGLKHLAEIVAADAHFAAEQGESRHFINDIRVLVGLSRQLENKQSLLVMSFIGLGMGHIALDQIDLALVQHADLFSDEDLHELAQLLNGPNCTADIFSLDDERAGFHDLIQRSYTDDGQGDGHITLEGINLMRMHMGNDPPILFSQPSLFLAGASYFTVASRQQVLSAYDSAMDEELAQWKRPLRLAGYDALDLYAQKLKASPARSLRYFPLWLNLPRLRMIRLNAEAYLAQRDALQIAMALELYHRHHGSYPLVLTKLVPAYLPAAPIDPITGGPLCYRLQDGKPLLYSVGADRDDDGGKIPVGKNGEPEPLRAANWDRENPVDGDWILSPQFRESLAMRSSENDE